jgi:hypothetical protein
MDADGLLCPFVSDAGACSKPFPSSKALKTHVRMHFRDGTCSSCGRAFTDSNEFLAHLHAHGCVKRSRRVADAVQPAAATLADVARVGPMAAPSHGRVEREEEKDEEKEPLHFDELVAAAPRSRSTVWQRLDEPAARYCDRVMRAAALPMYPLEDTGFTEEQLDQLNIDSVLAHGASLRDRVVPREALDQCYRDWCIGRDKRAAAMAHPSPSEMLVDSFAQKVARPGSLSGQDMRRFFSWFKEAVEPVAGRAIFPASFEQFASRMQARDPLIEQTLITTNPPLHFFHMPLLLASPDLVRDPRTVCSFEEQRAVNAATGEAERVIRQWIHGEKMREICSQRAAADEPFVAFSLFVDDTSASSLACS